MTQSPYVAVLQLDPPQTEGRLHITVTLHATDHVGSGANAKPLRDCTLAELQQFADELEQSFWIDHRNSTLQALLEDEKVTVAMQVDDGAGAPVLVDELLAASIILGGDKEHREDERDKPPIDAERDPDILVLEPGVVEPVTVEEITPEPPVTDGPEMPQSVADTHVEAGDAAIPQPIVTVPESAEPDVEATLVADEDEASDSAEADAAPDSPAPEIAQPETPPMRVAGTVRSSPMAQHDAADITLDETVMRAMQGHALSSMRREVAGVMLGPQPEKQPCGRYLVRVTDSIIAKHTRMSGASVTYTPESWRYINDQLAIMYPEGDAVIVGWYHTHPGFGIFLSGMDLFIHENFFTQPWHIAYVLDPVARRSGFFCWDRLQKRVKEYDLPWPDWARHSW